MKGIPAPKGKNALSLKWGLIVMVLVCWIFPVALLSGVTGYFINSNVNRQVSNTITSSTENAVKNALSQLSSVISASRYASYNGTVASAYQAYRKTGDQTALSEDVRNFLIKQYKYDDRFLLATLFFSKTPDDVYFTYSESYSGVRKYLNSAHPIVRRISDTLGTEVGFLNVNGSVYIVRNLVDSSYRTYAVLILQMNLATVFGGIQNVAWETDATVWINGAKVILRGSRILTGPVPDQEPQGTLSYRQSGNAAYVSGSGKIPDCRLSYLIRIDRVPLSRELSSFKVIILVILTLIIPLLIAVLLFFSYNVSVPIRKLSEEAKRIESGDFGVQLKDRFPNAEFRHLAGAFNSMSYKLKYQFERIYREKLALRDAKIMALQLQINPHFLNNTLEIINWEARLADDQKVSRMIEALSTLLDAAVDRKGRPVIPLSEELTYVDAYLYIISERFGKKLTIQKRIEPEAVSLPVPRLILQPVIENAVEHGFQAGKKEFIEIRAYREQDCLILEVENNAAISPEIREHVRLLLTGERDSANESSANLGIRNVHQRLKILFGEKSGFSMFVNKKNHTVARMTIHLKQLKQ